ncbi:MAG TPA: SAM-dependent methyltransferase [Gammaproteobacteria bacterium]|nr:SAM-dependent methyltransferase [Gammaproteobacteria bacterium]
MIKQRNDFPSRLHELQKSLSSLPPPSADARALSTELSAEITAAMAAAGGSLPFWKYMNMALYEPGRGYYSAGSHKLGAAGDFITAPEISPLFSRTLARASQPVLEAVENGEILEVGAGSGVMAATLLAQLAADNALPTHYRILELSAELRQRQQQTLNEQVPDLAARVHWCDRLPQNFRGLILANELLDALPAHRFIIETDEVRELFVTRSDNDFTWQSQPGSERLINRVREIEKDNGRFAEGYVSEILFAAEDWIHAAAKSLTSGMILLLDYGHARSAYYHPQRDRGTLSCHYRHRVHDDPFYYPGLQDITAHVDFTAIADAALAAGLGVTGYTTQAHFLLGSGITNWLADESDRLLQLDYSNQIKKLTLPQEMGETFKVMGLTKNCSASLPGFMLQDMRDRL